MDLKELRRKDYDEEEGSGAIDEKIEWFEDWNYPPRQPKH